MSDYFQQLRKQKELIKMRESALENWRDAVLSEEEHPFVDVMPEGTDEVTPKKKSKKKEEDKEEESLKKEEVRLDLFSAIDTRLNLDEARARTPEEARARLKAHREAMKNGGDSPYGAKKKEQGPMAKDPWSTHADDAKAHRKEDQR